MSIALSFLVFMLVALLARWLIAASRLQKAKEIAGATHFRGSVLVRLLFGSAIPIAFYGAVVVGLSKDVASDWWVVLVLIALAVSLIIGWPEQIVTNSDEVMQSRILGLGWRRLKWSEVDYAIENQTTGGVEVVPRTGRKIIHTSMHVGHDEFLRIVRDHCRTL